MNIMIVDDEPLEREALRQMIQHERFRVQTIIEAANGLEAVELAKDSPVDVVLMDIDMPVMDGLTAAHLIQHDRPQCAFIFFTTFSQPTQLAENPVPCFLKPTQPSLIMEAITQCMPQERYPTIRALQAAQNCTHPHIQRVMNYIETHVHEELKLESLAALVHFNEQYLSRLFKQETTYTITQYIAACRMEQAKHYLSYASDYTVVEISQLCGIADANYFARLFKKYEGMTPSQFQQHALNNRKKRMNSFTNFLM